jgi:ribokinase
LNAAPARADLAKLLPLVSVLVVNEPEAAELLGQALTTGAEGDAAMALLARGPRQAVITLGARGAVHAAADGLAHVSAPSVEVVDTTGAGDAFVGAMAVRLAGGAPLGDAVHFACAAGALACKRAGAQTALPHTPDVEALLRAHAGQSDTIAVHDAARGVFP